MDVPGWSSSIIDSKGVKAVEEAVAQAEGVTSGEIVPMVVRRSSTIGHVPVVLFLIIMSVMLMGTEVFILGSLYLDLDISDSVFLILAMVVSFAGSFGLSRWPFLQRMCVSKVDQDYQVFQRAQVEFHNSKITNTKDQTGVLIFVSLLEHRVVVLADRSISDHHPADVWQEVVDLVLGGIKSKDLAGGLSRAIARSGEILKTKFPVQEHDINELSDKLIFRD